MELCLRSFTAYSAAPSAPLYSLQWSSVCAPPQLTIRLRLRHSENGSVTSLPVGGVGSPDPAWRHFDVDYGPSEGACLDLSQVGIVAAGVAAPVGRAAQLVDEEAVVARDQTLDLTCDTTRP